MIECQFVLVDPSAEKLERKELKFMAQAIPREGDTVTFPTIDELKGRLYKVESILHGFAALEKGEQLHLITVHLRRLVAPLR